VAVDYEMKRGRNQVLLCKNRFKQRSPSTGWKIRADSRPLLPMKNKKPLPVLPAGAKGSKLN
jgi:hypothetical protein